jgi:tripartite-type tricarboxylate transporter receptor subunit TctC
MRKLERTGLFWNILLMILGLGVFTSHVGQAQEYPTRPVILIMPGGIGGSNDLTARAVASASAKYLGQPVIVEIKSGGSGAVGTEYVYKSEPDGYTILFGTLGYNVALPVFDGVSRGPGDLVAVCRINYSSPFIVARTDAPYKTFKEMIAWAKAHPGELVYAYHSRWSASHFPWMEIKHLTGIKTKDIPHTGGSEHLSSMLSGACPVGGMMSAQGLQHIRAGTFRALAYLDDKRDNDLPDVPTLKELGYNVVYRMWRGILAPKGTPRPIVDKLAVAFKKMTEDKSVKKMIKQFGDEIQYLGPDEFSKEWEEEYQEHLKLKKVLMP